MIRQSPSESALCDRYEIAKKQKRNKQKTVCFYITCCMFFFPLFASYDYTHLKTFLLMLVMMHILKKLKQKNKNLKKDCGQLQQQPNRSCTTEFINRPVLSASETSSGLKCKIQNWNLLYTKSFVVQCMLLL